MKYAFEDMILFENRYFVAINKPPGLSTLADRQEDTNVLSLAKREFPEIKVCHRLDKYTSGVLLLAKDLESYKHANSQFEKRKVQKTYHAIVSGNTLFTEHVVDIPIRVKGNRTVSLDRRNGKESSTHFSTIANYKNCSVLSCKPITGRMHQIRVHLKSMGHSIVGDHMYGGIDLYLSQIKKKYKQGRKEERPLIQRMALHARELRLRDLDQSELQIEAPYPRDFDRLLTILGKYA